MKSSKDVVSEDGRVFCEESYSNKCGRPGRLSKENLAKLLDAYYTRPYSLRQLAAMFGVSRMTVWRAVNNSDLA
jgi:transcriptional regulator of acetoin/glycerol metabolism